MAEFGGVKLWQCRSVVVSERNAGECLYISLSLELFIQSLVIASVSVSYLVTK